MTRTFRRGNARSDLRGDDNSAFEKRRGGKKEIYDNRARARQRDLVTFVERSPKNRQIGFKIKAPLYGTRVLLLGCNKLVNKLVKESLGTKRIVDTSSLLLPKTINVRQDYNSGGKL